MPGHGSPRGGSRDPARAGSACDGWAEPERVTPAGDWQTTGELAMDVPFLLRSYVHLLVRYLLYILRARLGPMPKDSSIKNIKTYLRAPARKSLARSLGLPPKFITVSLTVSFWSRFLKKSLNFGPFGGQNLKIFLRNASKLTV